MYFFWVRGSSHVPRHPPCGILRARRGSRSSRRAQQSTGLSARLIQADKEPVSRADTGNKAGCLTPIYGGRLKAAVGARAYVEDRVLRGAALARLLNNAPIKQQRDGEGPWKTEPAQRGTCPTIIYLKSVKNTTAKMIRAALAPGQSQIPGRKGLLPPSKF